MAAIPGILILFILVAAVVYGTNRMVKEDTTQYDLQFLWDRYPITIEQIEKKG
ncbi:hypothetical protein LOK74_18215 [Brevibacillus humidisoli]|uniref:hypothetical protein n=1 Tax=Brevibacillus humidisoli TaxID=2895522 RepID=UPI001E59C836|nr:hypothetical protein [Brevibacillus humidisoli]UFJ39962.1 hypothetical protein LOK74_18215 [Brevibacillus humidisoli]